MLDIDFIKNNREIVQNAIKNKNKGPIDLDRLLLLYETRKSLINEIDKINRDRKQAADSRSVQKGIELKNILKEKEEELKVVMQEFLSLMNGIPNVPLADVPIGKDDSENVVIRQEGEKRNFTFTPIANWDIGEDLNLFDTKRASKTTGARFVFFKGDIVKLQFAIIQWILDVLTNENILNQIIQKNNLKISSKAFIPIIPPAMVKPEMLYATGRLDPKEDKFFTEKDNLFLAGSAEQPIMSMHAQECFDEKDLPLRYIGYSTAFRREAGSYGKDTRGILRLHQFDKAEMVSFSVPETSLEEHNFFVSLQEYFVSELNIPYQVVMICTGDMGFPDQRQVDIECFMPGQQEYRETHTADFNGGFQSRRLGTKVKRSNGEREFVHTNDGTAFAMARLFIAILENYQQKDGTVKIPEILHKYGAPKILKN